MKPLPGARRTRLLVALAGMSLLATACGQDLTIGDDGGSAEAACADYPKKQDVTMVVGRSPGGGHDEDARFLAPLIEKELGATVVVENVDGAGGRVAAEDLAKGDPDGYTIHMMEPNGLAALQLVQDTSYDVEKSYTYLGLFNERPSVFAVAADSPIKTFDDLVAAGKKRKLKFATAGLTSPNFVNGVIAADSAGMQITPVPHEGSPEAITSVVRGDTDFTMFSGDSVAEGVKEGDLRALAQFGEKPLDMLGDVPTASEVGLENLQGELTSALTLVAPPDLPPCVEKPLTKAVQKSLDSPKLDEFAADGRIVNPGPPQAARQVVGHSLETYQAYTDVFKQYLKG
ncbi:MAG: Bug family tripartite tricarboxylate transporter substrate binding protein [Actinomycetes bacterium]